MLVPSLMSPRRTPAFASHVGRVIIVQGEAELLEVVGTFQAIGRFAYFLHRGQKQADQDRDDSDNHEQLDQGEATSRALHERCLRLRRRQWKGLPKETKSGRR